MWENKAAIVTGAASGIGYLTAERFAKNSVRVALLDVNPTTVSPGNINPDPNFTPKSSYMNRSGHPRECAEAICFLASDKASFISGCDYVVDGCRRKL